jgi:5'-3' exoribonuclease 2
MRINLYAKLDLLMSFVRPKSVVFLAIDGVAPRAKLNQQRSRRFKSTRLGSFVVWSAENLISCSLLS